MLDLLLQFRYLFFTLKHFFPLVILAASSHPRTGGQLCSVVSMWDPTQEHQGARLADGEWDVPFGACSHYCLLFQVLFIWRP